VRGYSEDEIGTDEEEWSSRIHPDDFERVFNTVQQYLNKKTPKFQCEYRTRCKDGSYLWIIDRGIAVWDAKGETVWAPASDTRYDTNETYRKA
jgi:PAS domain-containing protein